MPLHWSLQYSKSVSAVTTSPTPFLDTAFVDTLNTGQEKAWFTTVLVDEPSSPSRHTLGVLGKFKCRLTHGGIVSQQEVFVVKGLKNNLMGLPAITSSS